MKSLVACLVVSSIFAASLLYLVSEFVKEQSGQKSEILTVIRDLNKSMKGE